MRNFFRKRRTPSYGDEDMRPEDFDPVLDTGAGPRLVPPLGRGPALSAEAEEEDGGDGRGMHSFQRSALGIVGERASERADERGSAEAAGRGAPQRPLSTEEDDPDLELPQFRMPVTAGLQDSFRGRLRDPAALPGMTPELNRALREAFTPTRPKQQVNSLFVGRLNTLRRIIAAIEEERAHVVLFGDRGRGKTSLANAVQQIANQAGYFTLKLTCSAELAFEDVFRNFLRRIPSSYYQSSYDNPFSARRSFNNFEELLPEGQFSVTELCEVLNEMQGAHVLLILDEYDRVTGDDMRNKLAELIKNLTDSSIPVTLFIVGVAENVDQLLGKHPSIQRSLVAVHLPLMTDKEVERIILAGAQNAGIDFDTDVRRRIVTFAKGLPYYAQLLSLHAARSAVSRGSIQVGRQDLAYAVARCVSEAERGIVEAYNRALGPDRKASFADVLYVAAQCRADEFGVFHPTEMADVPLHEGGEPLPLLSLQYPLSRLVDDERGAILQKVVEPGGHRYRFRHQMMRQYVLMRQAKDRGLT